MSIEHLAALDRLGHALRQLGRRRVNLSWDGESGLYHIDGKDSEGRYFHGFGATPSAALTLAERVSAEKAASGVLVHA